LSFFFFFLGLFFITLLFSTGYRRDFKSA
jgi:hypothetical protein